MIRYAIYESSPHIRRFAGKMHDTFPEAVAHAKASYRMAHYEEDPDYPGKAANFLTVDGRVFGIEAMSDLSANA